VRYTLCRKKRQYTDVERYSIDDRRTSADFDNVDVRDAVMPH